MRHARLLRFHLLIRGSSPSPTAAPPQRTPSPSIRVPAWRRGLPSGATTSVSAPAMQDQSPVATVDATERPSYLWLCSNGRVRPRNGCKLWHARRLTLIYRAPRLCRSRSVERRATVARCQARCSSQNPNSRQNTLAAARTKRRPGASGAAEMVTAPRQVCWANAS